jgi:dethiobiotin synthetase
MTKYFITATGTNIGKTYVSCSIIKDLVSKNKSVLGLKPIISGWEDGNDEMDTNKILNAMGREPSLEDIDIISPWRFSAPLSPDMAASLENSIINFQEVVNFCNYAKDLSKYLIIEGAGGVMTPINDSKTFLDLIQEISIPVILVTGSYLGSISHTLTAINALETRNIIIDRIIINQTQDGVDINDTKKTLSNFTDIKIEILIIGGGKL